MTATHKHRNEGDGDAFCTGLEVLLHSTLAIRAPYYGGHFYGAHKLD